MNNSNNRDKYEKHQQYLVHFNHIFTKKHQGFAHTEAAYNVSFRGHTLQTKKKAQKINKKMLIIIISLHRKFKSHFANSTKMKDMQEMSGCACMGNCFIQVMRFTGLKNCICLKLLFSSIIMKPCITILSQK